MIINDKWVFWMCMVAVCTAALAGFQRDRANDERDAARIETKVIAALYNGVLIGRGCKVPE